MDAASRVTAIVVVIGASFAGDAGAAKGAGNSLCARVDPASRRSDMEDYHTRLGRQMSAYGGRDGLERLRAELPALLVQVEDGDAGVRLEAAARLGHLRGWLRQERREDEARQVEHALTGRLGVETQENVAEELLSVLGNQRDDTSIPYLADAIGCDRNPGLRRIALQLACDHPGSTLVEPLLSLWKRTDIDINDRHLASMAVVRTKDRRAFDVALDTVGLNLPTSPDLLRMVGKREDVPRIIAAYKASRLGLGKPYWEHDFFRTLGALGGPAAEEYLAERFHGARDKEERSLLADYALQAQMEPIEVEDPFEEARRRCTTWDELRVERLPRLHREVTRLLDERNRPYFQAASWNRGGATMATFQDWSKSLSADAKVAFWRRVRDMLGDNATPTDQATVGATCITDLAKALAGRASARAATDPQKAIADIEEALKLGATVPGFNATDQLRAIRDRIERLRGDHGGEAAMADVQRFAGQYGRAFDGAHRLTLRDDGTYVRAVQSDAIDLDRPNGSATEGTFGVEHGRLVLTPGPIMHGYDIDAPDVLLPVRWGSRLYLLDEWQLEQFCQQVNMGAMQVHKNMGMYFYVHADTEETPDGLPEVPVAWQGHLLKAPVVATVTSVGPEGTITVDAGAEQGLKLGMRLYSMEPLMPDVWGVWRLEEVGARTSEAVFVNQGHSTPHRGIRVSTRFEKKPQ